MAELEEVFPESLLEALSGLRIAARRVLAGGRHGEHHAREAGSGLEFRDYRAYAPGDDIRRIDWHLFRRFERLYLRLLDELKELPVHVLLDVSDSAWAEDPPRSLMGRRVAGVFAAVALNQLDPVSVWPFGARLGEGMPPTAGKRRLPQVLRHIAGCERLGKTDLGNAIEAFGRLPLRRGLVVLVSDFFDPAGLAGVEKALATLRHRVVLVRLLRASDANPVETGELRLTDAETGEELIVGVDERVLESYRTRYAAFEEGLRDLALQRGCPLLEIDCDEPLLPQFEPLFQSGVYRP